MDKVLISGATGFIGARLHARLQALGKPCRLLVRQPLAGSECSIGDLADIASLRRACTGIDTVFHCAGLAHVHGARRNSTDSLHWQTNFVGTRNLGEAAAACGVRRLVFLSSVKAMAEPGSSCVDEDHPGDPGTAYGHAKRQAEAALLALADEHDLHAVNLRLSMVYGAGSRGNLERMLRLVRRGIFPPLPETGNRRSLVHVDDVVSAALHVATDPRARGRTYIVASQETPSGRQLLETMYAALGQTAPRWSLPYPLLAFAARVGDALSAASGRRLPFDSEALARLLDSACYSPARIERELGWRARVSLAEGLRECLGKSA